MVTTLEATDLSALRQEYTQLFTADPDAARWALLLAQLRIVSGVAKWQDTINGKIVYSLAEQPNYRHQAITLEAITAHHLQKYEKLQDSIQVTLACTTPTPTQMTAFVLVDGHVTWDASADIHVEPVINTHSSSSRITIDIPVQLVTQFPKESKTAYLLITIDGQKLKYDLTQISPENCRPALKNSTFRADAHNLLQLTDPLCLQQAIPLLKQLDQKFGNLVRECYQPQNWGKGGLLADITEVARQIKAADEYETEAGQQKYENLRQLIAFLLDHQQAFYQNNIRTSHEYMMALETAKQHDFLEVKEITWTQKPERTTRKVLIDKQAQIGDVRIEYLPKPTQTGVVEDLSVIWVRIDTDSRNQPKLEVYFEDQKGQRFHLDKVKANSTSDVRDDHYWNLAAAVMRHQSAPGDLRLIIK